MKKVFMMAVMLLGLCHDVCAQEEKDVKLKEVTVEAARIVRKADGQLILPSDTQKESSANGYSLLSKLNLPLIRVDEVAHTITAVGNQGSVQIRINGIIASKEELMTLEPKCVKSIDFIDNPGLRYGEGVAYVVDLKVKRNEAGYVLGLDASNTLTTWNGNNTVYTKMNHKNSEFGITYNFSYRDFSGTRYDERADYLLNDGNHYIVSRNDEASRRRNFGNLLELKYSLANSSSYIFQAVFTADMNNKPNDWNVRRIIDGESDVMAHLCSQEKSLSPVLDLYFYHTLGSHQSFTANVTGTHICTDAYNYNDEGKAYSYSANGNMWSLIAEAIYENRLKPFTVSMGTRMNVKYTDNDYSGDVSSMNNMHSGGVYVFGEMKGKLWQKIRYVAGLGVSNQQYSQDAYDYSFWLLRPKATLTYSLAKDWQLRYSFEISQHVSQVAMISDTRIRQNSKEWTVGNPNVEPNSVMSHKLRLSYTKSRFSFYVDGEYRNCRHPNLALYTRTADDEFLYTQKNQGAINMISSLANIEYDVIPDRLTVSVNGGINRFINKGDDYSHYYTSYTWGANVQSYLGRWTLTAYVDNGWRWMEGESKCCQNEAVYLGTSYRLGSCSIGLFWQHPLNNNIKLYQAELLDNVISKNIRIHSSDLGNMLTLNFTWKLDRGRKYKGIERKLNNKDTDTGIMK